MRAFMQLRHLGNCRNYSTSTAGRAGGSLAHADPKKRGATECKDAQLAVYPFLLQDCEPSLLYELVMRLQMHMYLPNDYLCYCGDVAKACRFFEFAA